MENRSWSSTAGTPGTRTAQSGVRPFRRTTARPGNGTFSTYPNEPIIERREYSSERKELTSNETQAERPPPRASATAAETLLIIGNVNARQAAVRSIAWLDRGRCLSQRFT